METLEPAQILEDESGPSLVGSSSDPLGRKACVSTRLRWASSPPDLLGNVSYGERVRPLVIRAGNRLKSDSPASATEEHSTRP